MIKAAFACDLTRITGVKHEFEYRDLTVIGNVNDMLEAHA